MDAAGLAVGLVGLPNDILDLHERWDSAKDFDSQYRQALNTWDHSRIRLHEWISYAGYDGESLSDDHHIRLDDPDVLVAVRNDFRSISDITNWLQRRQAKLPISPAYSDRSPSEFSTKFLTAPALGHGRNGRMRSSSPIRGFLSWATHGKQFTERVQSLAAIVGRLFDLLPPPGFLHTQIVKLENDTDESLGNEDALTVFPEVIRRLHDLQLDERTRLQKFMLERREIDSWLNVPRVDQEYDMFVSSRVDGTCDWIFQNPAYLSWQSTAIQTGRVLWIHGPPGYGKTVLCARIVDVLKETSLLAYAFSSAYVQAGSKPDIVLRVWLSQLTRQSTIAHEVVWNHMTAPGAVGAVASRKEMQEALKSILHELPGCILTLDGLDEFERSGNSRGQLLETTKLAIAETDTRLLMVSRGDISSEMSIMKDCADPILHEYCLSDDDVKDDIVRFSNVVVDTKLPSQQANVRHALAHQMVEKAGGMFLWVRMQEPQLEDYKSRAALEKVISKMPKGLFSTYERTWREIHHLGDDDQERAFSILRWAIFAFRPLTVAELAVALLLEAETEVEEVDLLETPSITEEYINRGIKRVCGSFIEVRASELDDLPSNRTIHIVHTSAKDYLLLQRPGAAIEGAHTSLADVRAHHKALAMTCLRLVSNDAAWKLVDSEFRGYAAHEWPYHVRAAGGESPDITARIDQLFTRRPFCFESWRKLFFPEDDQAGGPLYYASMLNLSVTMRIVKDKQIGSLDEVGGAHGTALQATCAQGHEAAFELLLSWGADPNVIAGIHGTALICAIYYHRDKMATKLLDHRADPTLVVERDWKPTALHAAIFAKRPEMAELLLQRGAERSISVADRHGWTPLTAAVCDGSFEIVRALIDSNADPNIPHVTSKRTALESAAVNGQMEIVRYLLEHHAEPNARNELGNTVLHITTIKGDLGMIQLLLDHGAKLDLVNRDGETPLVQAVFCKHAEAADLLLRSGSVTSGLTKYHRTPLHIASAHGDAAMVGLLLRYGADPARTESPSGTGPGYTPLNLAAVAEHGAVVDLLLHSGQSIQVLYGARELETPVNRAAFHGHLRILELLFEGDPKGTSTDKYGRTAIHWAALGGSLDTFDYLIEKGFDPLAEDDARQTILHFAAASGSSSMVQKVLQFPGISGPTQKEAVWTPLHWASRRGDSALVRMLINAGATETSVQSSDPASSFTPWTIAEFHGNTGLISDPSYPLQKDDMPGLAACSNGFGCEGCQAVR
ncbi:ankyrin repeat-containing domain protein [Macrophomina phaseolina]|uniref:Ankyrin repeat-containing domain protein n=1 Tax=Macrophomina phaseolina TaxID=35725 RepID=A0ABQ8GR70_9PEZI|nr:ankyrin repeat-containing domain protein [Macrophomina phaseolina]